jgi:hypothetical protein
LRQPGGHRIGGRGGTVAESLAPEPMTAASFLAPLPADPELWATDW